MAEKKKSALDAVDQKFQHFVVNIRRWNKDANGGKGAFEDHYYMTVAGRLAMFWDYVKTEKNGADTQIRIETTVNQVGNVITVRAEAQIGSWKSVGHASEVISAKGVNATSALENAETSAIGRCLGNMGFGLLQAGDVASADEVKTAFDQQQSLKPAPVKKGAANEATTAMAERCQAHFEEGEDFLIEKNVADYSRKMYGKPLCRAHQKLAVRI